LQGASTGPAGGRDGSNSRSQLLIISPRGIAGGADGMALFTSNCTNVHIKEMEKQAKRFVMSI